MFTENEKAHILLVKRKIREKVGASVIFRKPYYQYLNNRIFSDFPKIYLSGGAIASLIQGQEPKDWDVYFHDNEIKKDFVKTLENSFQDQIKSFDNHYSDDSDHKPNAYTMEDGISFISIISGAPEEVKKTFDFVHCMAHYDINRNILNISKHQYDCMVNKILIQNSSNVPKEWRINKFKSRGYVDQLT